MPATKLRRLPAPANRRGDLALKLVLGAGVAWLLVYVGVLAWLGDVGSDLPQVAPPLAAGLAAAIAARRTAGSRMLWVLLAVSSLLWAAGALAGTISRHL